MASSSLGEEQCADQEEKRPVSMIPFSGFGESRKLKEQDPILSDRKNKPSLEIQVMGLVLFRVKRSFYKLDRNRLLILSSEMEIA